MQDNDAISEVSLPRIDKRYLPNQSSSSIPHTSLQTILSIQQRIKPIAAERWNIRKKRIEQDVQMTDFYNRYMSKCRQIENYTNQKSAELYNSIYYELKWANPPVAAPHIKVILNYCKHVIQHGSTIPYPNEVELATWNLKVKGLFVEKRIIKVKKMYEKLYKLIETRDTRLNQLQNDLIGKSEDMKTQNHNTLRWMMHHNHGRKDTFFTIWQLAMSNKIRELQVLLATPMKMKEYGEDGINARDPDFALTPLIYACRASHTEMVKYLLSVGANPLLKAPDGRTALHYVAAYANREILLMLLALGMDVEARDNYECTPLDLARQNVNKLTMPTLESWNKLTSMQILPTQSVENDSFMQNDYDDEEQDIYGENLHNKIVPLEYQATNALDFQQMSPSLKLLTKRLNGYNPYFTNPPKVTTDYMNSHMFSLSSVILDTLSNTLQESSRMHILSAGGSNLVSKSTTAVGVTNIPSTADFIPRAEMGQNPVGGQDQSAPPTVEGTRVLLSDEPEVIAQQESLQMSSTQQLHQEFVTAIEKFLTEIRLCSKHYGMCIAERFFDEGLKTLKRRWLVAKMLYNELHNKAMEIEEIEEPVAYDGSLNIAQDVNNIHNDSMVEKCNDEGINNSEDKPQEGKHSEIDEYKEEFRKVDEEQNENENENEEGDEEEEDEDDEEDEEANVSLEKIAADFLNARSNVTYMNPDENPDVIKKYKEEEILPQTFPSTVKISQLSDKLFVEEKAFEFYDDPYKVTTLELDVNKPPQPNDEKANSSPVYILDIMDKFTNYEHVKRLQEYSWRYENKEIIDHYTIYSNTTAGNERRGHGTGKDSSSNSIVSDPSLTVSSWSLSISRNPVQLHPSMSSVGGNSADPNPHKYGNFVIRLGYELVEVLLTLKKYSEAYQVMQDCLALYSDILISTRILVLFQKCDVLLYGYDHWEDVGQEMSEVVLSNRSEGEGILHTMSVNGDDGGEQAAELEQRSYSPLRYSNSFQGSSKVLEHSTHLDLNSRTLESSQNHEQSVTFSAPQLEAASSSVFYGEDSVDEPPLPHLQGTVHKAISSDVEEAKDVFLQECIAGAQEAIDLSYVLSRRHLIEGFQVAMALSFIAKCMERKKNVKEAYRYMDEAAILARRCRGASVETIEFMVEAQRLFVKYELSNNDHLKEVSKKSAEISELLTICAQHHTTAKVLPQMTINSVNSKASPDRKKKVKEHLPQLSATLSTSDSYHIQNPVENFSNVTGSQELEENAKTMHRIEELFRKNAEILGLATITLNDPTMEIKYIGAVASNSKVMVRTSSSEMLNASRSQLLQSKSSINVASSFPAAGDSYTLQPSVSIKSNASTAKSKKKKIVKYL